MEIRHGKIFTFNIFGYKCYKDALAGECEKSSLDVPIVAEDLANAKTGILQEVLAVKGKKWGLCHFTFSPTTDFEDVNIAHIPELEKKVIAPDLPTSVVVDKAKED
jgi:hypothetical protein